VKTYTYKTEQFLRTDIEKAWGFFATPKNLALITPPDLDFRILSVPGQHDIIGGMIIDYTVRPILGIRIRWKTEICEVERPFSFTDRQVKGPYAEWIHTHTFREEKDGVMMTDHVRYALPFGWIGRLTHQLVVQKKVEKIFQYRRQVLHKLFVENGFVAN
jgi:ligand-binding SRPBCC domain-containing protein